MKDSKMFLEVSMVSMLINLLSGVAVIVFMLFIFSGSFREAYAGELEAQMLSSTKQTERYDHGAGTWTGVQINYKFNDELYVFGANESFDVLLLGGKAWTYRVKGIGIGTKYRVSKRLRLFGQIGYYDVKNSWGNYQRRENNEAIHYYLNERYNNTKSSQRLDAYSVNTSDAVLGLTIGSELIYPITQNWHVGFVLSYRHIKIKEDISGYSDAWGCPSNTTVCDKWHSAQNEDYSSINMGLSLGYQF